MKNFSKRIYKLFISIVLVASLLFSNLLQVRAEINISSPSVMLIEASTGQVIYELNATERRSPASITKIMTLLLVFDELESGKVKLDDKVITSAHAKSMGGSQVFLEEGETQTLETMIKCIAVSSGNDASVAVAEYIAGSEIEFVARMNEKAKELGMVDTNFEDCCGLSDSDNHYTSAKDVAIMSRELVTKHPEIFDYTTIWMEDITHTTAQGSSLFTLSSTNKLLKQYPYATGLKTGSTSKAKYCLSATASKDGIDLIAVVMAAPDYKMRFQDAITLLNYGYSVSRIYVDENMTPLPLVPIKGGIEDEVKVVCDGPFRYLDIKGNNLSTVEKIISLPETAEAPVAQGDVAGEILYKLNGERIGSIPIRYQETIEKAGLTDFIIKAFRLFLL